MSINNKSNRPQKLNNKNTNLRLNDNDNTSQQQEDFFSFGDFTKDELNIYLNKNNNNNNHESENKTNKKSNNDINLIKLNDKLYNNNNIKLESDTSTTTTTKTTSNNSIIIPDNKNKPSLHGVNVPWQINTNINTNLEFSLSKTTSDKFQFNFNTDNLIKESSHYSSNSSYSPSPPPPPLSHLVNSTNREDYLFESNESSPLLSSDLISKLNYHSHLNYLATNCLNRMDTQIEKPINLTNNNNNNNTNVDINNANASANDQQRRNKKRKPPNYYQSAEYAAILKTTDESILLNSNTIISSSSSSSSTTTVSTPSTTVTTTTTSSSNNESSNDSKTNLTNSNDNNNTQNLISDVNNSQNTNEANTNHIILVNNITTTNKNTNITTSTSSIIIENKINQNSNEQYETVNTNSINTTNKSNDKLEMNIEKIQNLTLNNKTDDSLDNSNSIVNKTNETKQSQSATSTTTTSISAPSAKCWSSLFKSSAAQSTTTTTTNTQSQTNTTTTTTTTTTTNTNVTNHTSKQTNNNNNNNNKSKQALTSSTSLPISASTSSVSLSSSTSSNHVHLNGVSNHSANANGVSATSNVDQLDQQSNDVLRMLGTMFKQCELKHSAPALQPRGIRNKQNWCYVNATLQALLACPPFYNLIKSIFMKIKSSNTNIKNVPCIASLGRFISEFKTMIRVQPSHNENQKQSQSSSNMSYKELVIGEPFEVDYFYDTLANFKAELTFKSGRQEDAQEFLSFLLNRLHDEMVRCLESLNQTQTNENNPNNTNNNLNDHSKTNGSGINHLNNNNNSKQDEQLDEDDEWKEVGKKNRAFVTRKTEFKQSPLSDIFCGQFRSALSQPGVKDKESVSLEPFFTLPLDIQSDSVRNVQQALEHFVQKEEVYGFTNQETKQEIEAFKRISFEDLPPVLILYLKCFVYDKQGGIQKLLKRIDFQIDLEINRDLISPNQRSKLKEKKRNYKLFAVEYHHGDKANGGHYITDVYHPGIIGWVRYDDANVKVINNAQVLKSEDKKLIPYLLYYRRADLI